MTYRTAYLDRGRRSWLREELTLKQAQAHMKALKRHGRTAWVEKTDGTFVPVVGAKRRPSFIGGAPEGFLIPDHAEEEDLLRQEAEHYEEIDEPDLFEERAREQSSGRFAPTGMHKECVCGHTLGEHDAARERHKGRTYQECQADDCECFCYKRKARRTR